MSQMEIVESQFRAVQQYAEESFYLAHQYIDDLGSYVNQEIDTTAPTIDIPSTESIVVDPTISAETPVAPSSTDYPVAPSPPSDSGDHAFPGSPVYTLPTPPTLTDITIPDFVEGTISSITTTLPVIDFTVPSVPSIADGGQATMDTLLQSARDKLESNILSGGTMINPTVEGDIWDRNKERDEQTLQDSIDKVTAQWAKLGFSIPDGLLAGNLATINIEYINKRLDVSRDIAIKQAELEQQGMFKSLELAINIEQLIMGSFNEYAKRTFEASKTTADVTIELYKQRVVQYNVMLERFKTDVLTYKTSIEAEMARAEAYKSRITGLSVIAQIDDSKVKLYAAHLDAIGKMVDIYKTDIQAVAMMYDAEKQKVERYKAQVEAYVAGVDAVNKKYMAQVEGYKAFIEAWKASAASQTTLLEVGTKAKVAEVEAMIKEWEIQLRLVQDQNTLRMEALKTVATTASNLAAGALSAGHASAQVSFSDSDQTSKNYQYLE